MDDAIRTRDTSVLEMHLRKLSTDATEQAFAIMLGSAGRDLSIEERFMGVMMADRLLTVEDVAVFARQMLRAARESQQS